MKNISGIYKHFKGGTYRIIDVAKNSETLEDTIIYKSLYTGNFPKGQLWTRPLKEFAGYKTINNKRIKRFTKIK